MAAEELALALELAQLPDVLDLVLGDLMPHRLCGKRARSHAAGAVRARGLPGSALALRAHSRTALFFVF
jgi:hypothetical protein